MIRFVGECKDYCGKCGTIWPKVYCKSSLVRAKCPHLCGRCGKWHTM